MEVRLIDPHNQSHHAGTTEDGRIGRDYVVRVHPKDHREVASASDGTTPKLCIGVPAPSQEPYFVFKDDNGNEVWWGPESQSFESRDRAGKAGSVLGGRRLVLELGDRVSSLGASLGGIRLLSRNSDNPTVPDSQTLSNHKAKETGVTNHSFPPKEHPHNFSESVVSRLSFAPNSSHPLKRLGKLLWDHTMYKKGFIKLHCGTTWKWVRKEVHD